jgi:uncharacterized protein YwqG
MVDKKEKRKTIIRTILIILGVISFFAFWTIFIMINAKVGSLTFIAFIVAIYVIAYVKGKNPPKAKTKPIEKKVISEESKEKLDKIINILKTKTEITSYNITCKESDDISLFDSKFGGTPYWDLSKDYPKDSVGNKLILLAQINFEKEKFDNDLLPKDGMLQIFIDPNDEGWGLKFDGDYSKQEGWKVVYHKKVDYSVSENNIKKMGIPSNLDIDTYLMPVNGEYKMVFTPDIDYSIYNDNAQDELFDILKESGIIEDIKESFWDNFTSEEYDSLYDKLSSAGNKL